MSDLENTSPIPQPQPLISRHCGALRGILTPPGDKSISHRSIMLGGTARGTTVINGLLEGEDVLSTIEALRTMGAKIERAVNGDGTVMWQVEGFGLDGLREPKTALNMGNSGTAARLLMGLVSGKAFKTSFYGDASLSKRPMGRVIEPLSQMGAQFQSTSGRLPLSIIGNIKPSTLTYRLPVASAQVKSAILFAGLSATGKTTVIEAKPTRDHTENMLRYFGAKVLIEKLPDGTEAISVFGPAQLSGQNIVVPGDISSAAFPIVAAVLCPGSHLILKNVGINPRRAGLITTLHEMGANIKLENRRYESGEPVADLIVEGGSLDGVTVPADRAPSMIDEFPILAVAAACAKGTTQMLGLHELRVKESDRLTQMADGLKNCGVEVEVQGDDLIVHGNGQPPKGGGRPISTAMDHRIAMSFLVLGTQTAHPVIIDDGSFITTSFPNFINEMNKLGMNIEVNSRLISSV